MVLQQFENQKRGGVRYKHSDVNEFSKDLQWKRTFSFQIS